MSRNDEFINRQIPLLERCKQCHLREHPSSDRCEYHCHTGLELRKLEVEYSDVTGWSHKKW